MYVLVIVFAVVKYRRVGKKLVELRALNKRKRSAYAQLGNEDKNAFYALTAGCLCVIVILRSTATIRTNKHTYIVRA